MSRCPVCDSPKSMTLVDIPSVPVNCNTLWGSRETAAGVPRGDIGLVFCENCGHIYNTVFDPEKMQYNADYENSLHFSARFREYADSLAQELVDDYGLFGKDIVEIGSGKGDFLALLCGKGGNRGVGFDPSYEGHQDEAEGVRFIRDFYSEKYSSYPADLLCCRHVLEHIEKPAEFISGVRKALNGSPGSTVVFEVPNAEYMLKEGAVWDIIYEHCGYYTPESLSYLFTREGFKVKKVDAGFGGQFLVIHASPSSEKFNPSSAGDGSAAVAGLRGLAGNFSGLFRNKLSRWAEEVGKRHSDGRKIAVWGAGSKGISFLNLLELPDGAVEYVVDVNPRKQGRFLTGSAQKIIAPEFLERYRPDTVIVMNPVYRDEIAQILEGMKLHPEVMVM